MKIALCRVLFLSLLAFVHLGSVNAQTLPCGNIITPLNFYDGDSDEQITPIENCENPFDRTNDLTGFLINGGSVSNNSNYTVDVAGIDDYGFADENYYQTNYQASYYRHKGNDFIRVNTDFAEPGEAEIEVAIRQFFPGNTARADFYIEIYNSGQAHTYFFTDTGVLVPDPATSQPIETVFYDMLDYVEQNVVTRRTALLPGTYTVVTIDTDEGPNPTFYKTLPERLFAWLVPTAYAYYYVNTITFTLTESVPEPVGASSVLFLPGIQASRLYTKDEAGDENRIWEPNINADVAKLEMTEDGFSVDDVYTRDVVDEIFGVNNVYQTFLDMLEELESDEIIADSVAFAYDWRFGIQDIVVSGTKYENEVKSLVDELESLAEGSYTNKVTIIAHSNGGLVAKALIRELDRLGKTDLVDKLVMVGTPQLGTPKAIGVMLHGLGQQAGAGLIIDDETARAVIKNMPGAYTLLPSQKYFDKSGDIVVTSDQSENTTSVRAYGEINSVLELNNFLLDTSNLRDDSVSINEPSTLNSDLINNLAETRTWLDSWEAPAGVEVYEIIGTGIPTIKSFEYKSFPCASAVAVVCASGQYMKAYPTFSSAGDETVMALSAEGYDGDKVSAKVDLFLEGEQFLVKQRRHVNLTESPTVQEYLDSIIRFPYLNDTLEIPEDFVDVSREYTIIGSHSPVALIIEDDAGNQVGVIDGEVIENIPGSQYIELGGSTYIAIPKETKYTAKIKGTGTGLYSITVDKLNGVGQTSEYVYRGASTTPQMQAVFTASSTGFSNIETDLNGDGLIDLKQTLDGKIIPPVIVYTYSDLTLRVKGLGLAKLPQQLLLVQVQLAERFSLKSGQTKLELLTLRGIEDTLKLYERKRLITSSQRTEIQEIINYLKN